MELNPDKAWKTWKEFFLLITDIHAPIKRKRIRGKYAPWINSDLKNLMFQRDKLKKISAIKHQTDISWVNYKLLNNDSGTVEEWHWGQVSPSCCSKGESALSLK